MEIRQASINDTQALAALMDQLGYPTTAEQMTSRFQKIEQSRNHYTLVACKNDSIVGMIGFHTDFLYNNDEMYARIIAFVVDSSCRRKGIGRKLLKAAENLAKSLGAKGIGLNSGNRPERAIAHQFYESLGYMPKSTGFVKRLD